MRIHVLITAGLLSLPLAVPAHAQDRPAGLALVGCWAPADGFSARNTICLSPTASAMIEYTSISEEGKATVSLLSLDGRRVALQSETCTGWEEGRLTADGERLLVNAEITCGTDPKQLRTTAFTLAPSGHLLQVTGSGLAQVATTQLRVFTPVESYAAIPPATRELVMPYLVAAERERLDVRTHAVSAADLLEFERLGVATPLIDLMVAASYPQSFVIDGVTAGVSGTVDQGQAARRAAFAANPFGFMNGYPVMSMYDWQMMYECSRIGIGCPGGVWGYGYGSSMYGGYGWGAYGARGGYGWGGWGGYGVPGYGIPVVVRPVAPPSETGGTSGGRAVRGRGYTQTGSGSTGGGSASPRTSTGSSTSGASVQSGGSAGSSGGGAASSGSSGRTAKPRP